MPSLDAAEIPLHLEAVPQLASGNPLLQSRKCFFDLGHEAATDGFLLLLPPRRAAQAVGLFASRNPALFNLDFRTDLFEIILHLFLFELLYLASLRAPQILSAPLPIGP